MIPHELPAERIELPKTDSHTIALITGGELRHQRFAYRIQQEFGDLVKAWYQVGVAPRAARTTTPQGEVSRLGKAARLLLSFDPSLIRNTIEDRARNRRHRRLFLERRERQRLAERELFAEEVEELAKHGHLAPIPVTDPNSAEFIESLRKLDAFFLLSLGGPLYGKRLLGSVRGVALNQHAGWSPTYKGAYTTDWALYHRDLDHLGCTVHITTSGADAGPILRRSHPCLFPDDAPEVCFTRVVALGTELMCEVVRDVISAGAAWVFEQPIDCGRTSLAAQFDAEILGRLNEDFRSGWLGKELRRVRRF